MNRLRRPQAGRFLFPMASEDPQKILKGNAIPSVLSGQVQGVMPGAKAPPQPQPALVIKDDLVSKAGPFPHKAPEGSHHREQQISHADTKHKLYEAHERHKAAGDSKLAGLALEAAKTHQLAYGHHGIASEHSPGGFYHRNAGDKSKADATYKKLSGEASRLSSEAHEGSNKYHAALGQGMSKSDSGEKVIGTTSSGKPIHLTHSGDHPSYKHPALSTERGTRNARVLAGKTELGHEHKAPSLIKHEGTHYVKAGHNSDSGSVHYHEVDADRHIHSPKSGVGMSAVQQDSPHGKLFEVRGLPKHSRQGDLPREVHDPNHGRLRVRSFNSDKHTTLYHKADQNPHWENPSSSVSKAFDEMTKAGPGSRGGKIAYHTKSGKPVYQSAVKKKLPQFRDMMHNWHKNASQSKDPEHHATAAKQALAHAFYAHHAGASVDAQDAMDYADRHRKQYQDKGHSSRTTKWVDKNHGATHALVHGSKEDKPSSTAEAPSSTSSKPAVKMPKREYGYWQHDEKVSKAFDEMMKADKEPEHWQIEEALNGRRRDVSKAGVADMVGHHDDYAKRHQQAVSLIQRKMQTAGPKSAVYKDVLAHTHRARVAHMQASTAHQNGHPSAPAKTREANSHTDQVVKKLKRIGAQAPQFRQPIPEHYRTTTWAKAMEQLDEMSKADKVKVGSYRTPGGITRVVHAEHPEQHDHLKQHRAHLAHARSYMNAEGKASQHKFHAHIALANAHHAAAMAIGAEGLNSAGHKKVKSWIDKKTAELKG